jgi:hypothetical protein
VRPPTSAATQAPAPVIWWAMEKLAMRGAPPWPDHSANAIRAEAGHPGLRGPPR